jgi:hypothetical protein
LALALGEGSDRVTLSKKGREPVERSATKESTQKGPGGKQAFQRDLLEKSPSKRGWWKKDLGPATKWSGRQKTFQNHM